MKKIAVSILLIVICFGFVGCGKKDGSKEKSKDNKATVEYKDYDGNGKINYLDKTYAVSQATGLNIEYTTTINNVSTNYKLTIKDNMISSLVESTNSGEFLEFKDLGDGKKGVHYKKENGVWKKYGDIGFKSSDNDTETLKRKDIYIYIDRIATSMSRTMAFDEYKVGEVTHAGRQCTKYVQQVTLSTGSYEKILYVDNETEMPLYYKDNLKTVEVTKFETSADLSVPEV